MASDAPRAGDGAQAKRDPGRRWPGGLGVSGSSAGGRSDATGAASFAKKYFNRPVIALMLLGGVRSAIVTLGLFIWLLHSGRPLTEAMAMTFVLLVLIQFSKAYQFRSDRLSSFRQTLGEPLVGSRGAVGSGTSDRGDLLGCSAERLRYLQPVAARWFDDPGSGVHLDAGTGIYQVA